MMRAETESQSGTDSFTVCQLVHGLPIGGAEKLVSRIIQQLTPHYRFVVACLDEIGELGETLSHEGIRVVHMRRRPHFDWSCVRRLQRLFLDERVQLIHAHQCTPFSYALATGLFGRRPPVLLTEHGRFYPDLPSLKRKLFNRLLLDKRDRLVAVGNSVRQALIDNEGLPPDRIQVVYNGIELAQDENRCELRRATRTDLGVSEDEFMVLQVARLDPIKDHTTAIRAIRYAALQDRRIRLFVVGEGPECSSIQQAIRDCGIEDRVTLLGMRTDIRFLLSAADAFLLTSLSEGIPVTILEAMAAGVPVVATNVGGIPEILEDSVTGLLAPPENVTCLADALLQLAENSTLASSIAKAAMEVVQTRFCETKMISAYEEIYLEVAKAPSRLTRNSQRRQDARQAATKA